jgi:hypothetical protein
MSAGDIWVMNANGSSPKRLAAGSPSCEGTGDDRPAFSPDGTLIAFDRFFSCVQSDLELNGEIWVMGADGASPHKVSNPAEFENDKKPDWQPLANVVSAAQVPPCSQNGNVAVTVGDASGFKSGPKAVHYQIDGGPEQIAPTSGDTATITVPEGRHTLSFWGENQAGDLEAARHDVPVLVDSTNPHIVILRDQHRATFRRGQLATVTIKVTDAGGSGLVRDPSRRHLRVSTTRLGLQAIRVTALDACGNAASQTLRYRVVTGAVANRRVVRRPRFTG